MIRLIRKDGLEILLNADLIKLVEQRGDTVILLTTGDEIMVKNSPKDIMEKIRAFKQGMDSDIEQKD